MSIKYDERQADSIHPKENGVKKTKTPRNIDFLLSQIRSNILMLVYEINSLDSNALKVKSIEKLQSIIKNTSETINKVK